MPKNPITEVNNLFLLGTGFTKSVFPNAPLNEDLLEKKIVDRYFVDINSLVDIRLFSEGLESVSKD